MPEPCSRGPANVVIPHNRQALGQIGGLTSQTDQEKTPKLLPPRDHLNYVNMLVS